MTDRYAVIGETIGSTLHEAATWALGHPSKWAALPIILHIDGEEHGIDVDADVRDLIESWRDNAKSDVQVLREALQQLSAAFTRHTFEASAQIEALTKRIEALEAGK